MIIKILSKNRCNSLYGHIGIYDYQNIEQNQMEAETLDSVVKRYKSDQIGGLYLPSDELFSVLPYCSWILVAAKLDLLLLFLSDILNNILKLGAKRLVHWRNEKELV